MPLPIARLAVLLILAVLFLLPGCGPDVAARSVVVLSPKGVVTPVMAGYINRGITQAERSRAAAVVLQIDTPGGLDSSMREIVQRMAAATVPVIAWVAPSGARAASAGTFIVMAAPVAAMAPTTAIGAAHPVGSGGEDIGGTMGEKVTNDAVAYIRGVAQQHGRNPDWAERAVRESVSIPADEAVREHVVDFIAADLTTLLETAHGRQARLPGGMVTLQTAGALVQREDPNPIESLFAAVADPNIAFLLMSLAMLAIFIELSHPGAILPGVVGGLALILGLFGVGTLPVNLAGLALLGFGFLLLLAETWIASSGVLAIGGVVALGAGAMLLTNNTAPPELEVNRWLIAGTMAALGIPILFVARSLSRLRHAPTVVEGLEGLVGQRGVARTNLAPTGTVLVHGELWNATSEHGAPIVEAERVVVTGVDGFELRVRRAEATELVD